jgi:hypothetical protein
MIGEADPYRHKGVIDSLVKDDQGKPTGRYIVIPSLSRPDPAANGWTKKLTSLMGIGQGK